MTLSPKLLAFPVLALASLATPCRALDILLTNDDGFEASMLHALYQRLKHGGHRVLISAPAMDGTAMSGALPLTPVGPLPTPSRAGHVPAGARGVGTLASDANVFYVNSTPAVSLLHGVDIAARRRWGKAPDLVISGPNYGNNLGLLTTHSGTFNAAMTALNRGLPAIAVSAASLLTWYRGFEALRPADREHEIAAVVVRLVDELVRTRAAPGAPLLPVGIGLNVNLPEFFPGTGARLPYKFGKVGTAVFTLPVFVENLARDPIAGLLLPPPLPGVSVHLVGLSPGNVTRIDDRDPSSEQNIVNAGAVAISVVQSTNQASVEIAERISRQLGALVQTPAR
jgi:5'-nucleotidase